MELCTQETPVKGTEDSVQNRTAERVVEQNKRNEGSTRSKKKNILCESFPWYEEFKEMCSCPDYTTSMKGLVRLVRVYIGYISRDVASCLNKPSRACKIKQNLSRVLVFFNMRYKKLDPIFDESDYMDLMSQLLTMYLDIGVKASRRGKESARIIAKKTTSILFVILNNSPDHIIDTLLKAEHLYKPRFKELFIPTFMKVIHLPPTTGLTYIRFLFIYKIWKHLSQDNDDRCRLNKLAVASLKPSPRLVDLIERGKFFNILPNLLLTNDYSSPSKLTRFYMTTKFDLKSSVKEFLKLTQWMKVYHLRPNLEALENYKEENLQPNLSVISVDDDKSTEDENWIPDHPSSFNDPYANIPGNEFVPRPLRPSNFDSTMNVISIDLTQNPNKNSSENQENESKDLTNNVLPDTIDNQNKKPPKKINKKKKSKKSSQGSFQHDTEQFLKTLSLDDFQRNVEEPSSSKSNNTQISKENSISQKTLLPNTQTQESNNNIPTPFSADDNYIAINKDTNVKSSDAEHRRTNSTLVEKSSKRLECSKARKRGVTISEKRVVSRALAGHKNDLNKVQNELASENIYSKYNDCINNLETTTNSISLIKNYEKIIGENDYDLNQNENYNPIKESNSPVDHHINSDMECMGLSRVSVVDTSKLLESNWLQHCVSKIKQESHSLSDQPMSESNFLSHDTFGKVNRSGKPSEVFSSNANLVNVPECSVSNMTEYESEESNLVIDEDVDCLREATKAVDQNSREVQESSAAVISNIAMEVDQPDQNILVQSARSTDTNLRIISEKVTNENQINIEPTLSKNNLSRPTEEKQQKQSGHDKTVSVSEIQMQSQITRDNLIQRNEGNEQLSQTPTMVVADIYVETAVQHNNVVTQETASFDLDSVRFNKTDSNMNLNLEDNSPDEHLISNVCSSQSSQKYSMSVQNNQLVNKRSTISYDDVIPITGPQPQSQSSCASSVTYHEFSVPYVPYTVNNMVDAMCAYEFDLAVAQEVEVCSAQDGGAGELIDTGGVDNAPPARTPTPAESYVTAAQSNNHKYELQQVSIDTPSGTFIENRGMHKKTIENDISMCGSQREFKQFYLYQKVAPTIPVPLPIQDMPESCARCLCDVCLKNHKTLMFNYSVLRYMQDSKLKDSGKGNSPVTTIDKDVINDCDSNLPLKKRRTMTKTTPKETELYSYPNIPMMSIAQLQISNTMPSNKLADWNSSRKTCSEDPINLVQSKQSTTQKQTKQTKRKATKRRKSSR